MKSSPRPRVKQNRRAMLAVTLLRPLPSPEHKPLAEQIRNRRHQADLQRHNPPRSLSDRADVISDYFCSEAGDAVSKQAAAFEPVPPTPQASACQLDEKQPTQGPLQPPSTSSSSGCSAAGTTERCKNCTRRIFVPNGLQEQEEAQFCSGECLWSFRFTCADSFG